MADSNVSIVAITITAIVVLGIVAMVLGIRYRLKGGLKSGTGQQASVRVDIESPEHDSTESA